MQLHFRPLPASTAGVGGFHAARLRSGGWSKGMPCRNVVSVSSSGNDQGGGEATGTGGETPEEARKRLADLDALLEGLKEPKVRPPAPPPPPDPYMDREMITGRGSTDELPELSPTYVAFTTFALVILTVFTNLMFNLYVKPSVDGFDPPVRLERVPMVNPSDRQLE